MKLNFDFNIEADMEKSRSRRISIQQRTAMLDYVRRHPNLLKGRGKNMDPWMELAKVLNAISSGPKKSADKWLRSFQDWKSDVKAKQQRLRQQEPVAALAHHESSLLQLLAEHGQLDNEDPLEVSTNEITEIEPLELKPEMSEVEGSDVSCSPPSLPSSPEVPTCTRKKKKKREKRSVEEESSDKEERAIRAMEHQATSLDRMASAMERIADAVTMAVERYDSNGQIDTLGSMALAAMKTMYIQLEPLTSKATK